MASQRMNERFNKYLDPFVNLCHACGYKPTSVLLVSTMWYDGGGNVGSTELYEKTLELEENFSKGYQLCHTLDPAVYSVRFNTSHNRISACDAIDLMHAICAFYPNSYKQYKHWYLPVDGLLT